MGRNALKNQQCQLLANFSKNIQGVNIKPCFSKAFSIPAGWRKPPKNAFQEQSEGHLRI
jgi:hypothetical protein